MCDRKKTQNGIAILSYFPLNSSTTPVRTDNMIICRTPNCLPQIQFKLIIAALEKKMQAIVPTSVLLLKNAK